MCCLHDNWKWTDAKFGSHDDLEARWCSCYLVSRCWKLNVAELDMARLRLTNCPVPAWLTLLVAFSDWSVRLSVYVCLLARVVTSLLHTLQELWKMVVHSLEKIVVLPPLTDPRAVSLRAHLLTMEYLIYFVLSVIQFSIWIRMYVSGASSPRVNVDWGLLNEFVGLLSFVYIYILIFPLCCEKNLLKND